MYSYLYKLFTLGTCTSCSPYVLVPLQAVHPRYLHKLFTQLSKHKGKLKVRHLPIEDITATLPHHLEVKKIFFPRGGSPVYPEILKYFTMILLPVRNTGYES